MPGDPDKKILVNDVKNKLKRKAYPRPTWPIRQLSCDDPTPDISIVLFLIVGITKLNFNSRHRLRLGFRPTLQWTDHGWGIYVYINNRSIPKPNYSLCRSLMAFTYQINEKRNIYGPMSDTSSNSRVWLGMGRI